METSQLISTILSYVPDNCIALVAVIVLYLIINNQRKNTKVERDNTAESFDKRLTLVEHDVEALKDEHKAFGEKLDSIIDILTQLRIDFAANKEKK